MLRINNKVILSKICNLCKQRSDNISLYETSFLCRQCYELELENINKMQLKRSFKSPEITKITENIYLGNQDMSFEKDKLKSLGVTHILVVGTFLNAYFPDDFKYLILEVDDKQNEDISKYFVDAFKFIENSNKIFIHCFAGKSRSPSIVIAYMMWKSRLSYPKIYSFVRGKRSSININNGFKKTLFKFQKFLESVNYYIVDTKLVVEISNQILEKF